MSSRNRPGKLSTRNISYPARRVSLCKPLLYRTDPKYIQKKQSLLGYHFNYSNRNSHAILEIFIYYCIHEVIRMHCTYTSCAVVFIKFMRFQYYRSRQDFYRNLRCYGTTNLSKCNNKKHAYRPIHEERHPSGYGCSPSVRICAFN